MSQKCEPPFPTCVMSTMNSPKGIKVLRHKLIWVSFDNPQYLRALYETGMLIDHVDISDKYIFVKIHNCSA